MTYSEFFSTATGNVPFAFQERLRSDLAASMILKAPTGLGKTDSVLVAWLHWRTVAPEAAPRRLIWCLPGRALTEQVAKGAEGRIAALVKAGVLERTIPVYRLLGGSTDNDAKLQPDEAAVLVGTQDLLLSRALNRGYARSPFRWPMDFGLLNSDCYWVLDEVQLLGDGLATSLQLAAFRERFGVFGGAPSCWISATIDPGWMETVDFSGAKVAVIRPDDADRSNPLVAARLNAEKLLEPAPPSCRMPQGVAEFVAERHALGSLTLVIANTVRRAVEIRAALEKKTQAEVRLLHSRFRAADRKAQVEAALGAVPEAGRIVVATQVIEAGIDMDASLMVTRRGAVREHGAAVRASEPEGRAGRLPDLLGGPAAAEKQKKLVGRGGPERKDQEKVYAPYDAGESQKSAAAARRMNSAAPARSAGD